MIAEGLIINNYLILLLFLVHYNNRQWPTVVYCVLDTQKCFDPRKKSLEIKSEDFLECVKIFLNSIGHGLGHCLLFLEHSFCSVVYRVLNHGN